MNGFTNTALTLLLGWLKDFVSHIWALLDSDYGGTLYSFFAANWKLLIVILCLGGFAIDRIVYFVRWRPYYVWSSKLSRLRTKRDIQTPPPPYVPEWDENEAPQEPQNQPIYQNTAPATDFYSNQATMTFAPVSQAAYRRPAAQAQMNSTQPGDLGTLAYAPQSKAYAPPTDPLQPTVHYAPLAHGTKQVPYRRPYEPPYDLEPVFDDELTSWEAGETLVRPLSQSAFQNPAYGMENSFGSPKPEPIDYIRDMQAGFAPIRPPQQLYTQPPQPAPRVETPLSPVHPGLDSDAFRHSFGLTPSGTNSTSADSNESLLEAESNFDHTSARFHVPSFMPYAHSQSDVDEKTVKTRNPFASIAKKARDLVGVENEDQRPTIHDLQPTVNMRAAFHEPVYPKPKDIQGGD